MVKTGKTKVLFALAVAVMIAAGVFAAGLFTPSAAITPEVPLYYTDYATYQDEQTAAEELLEQIGEEGAVLLKNNGALPFDSDVRYISMFGAASVDPCYGGGGSGAANFSSYQTKVTPQMALEDAGFKVNPRLVNFYENEYLPTHPKTATDNSEIKYAYQEPSAEDLEAVEDSYSLYGDAALIFKYGSGSEGTDKLRDEYDDGVEYTDEENAMDGITSPTDTHNLEFTPREIELVNYVADHFDTVILVLNTGNAYEMSWMQDNDDIDGILWVGNPGTSGFASLGKLLNGTVSPSGHLADIYPADFTQDPSWYNYGDNVGTTGVYQAYDKDGELVSGIPAGRVNADQGVPMVEYEEGIYYGYRWYETASVDGRFDEIAGSDVTLSEYMPETDVYGNETDDVYYNRYNGVVYPFGFGLSYADFSWTIDSYTVDSTSYEKTDEGSIAADSTVTINVTVTNDSDTYAGKDVVQVYYNPPYTSGEIEKAPVNLIQFGKTKTLKPGESQKLSLSFDVKDMASFDYDNRAESESGFCGYKLEAGDYAVSLNLDSHNVKDDCTITLNVGSDIEYDGSDEAHNWNAGYGETAEAIFSQDDIFNSKGLESATSTPIFNEVTRGEGFLLPEAPTIETSKVSDEVLGYIADYNTFTPLEDKTTEASELWYKEADDIPEGWMQGAGVADENGQYAILAPDMAGIDPTSTDTVESDNDAINGLTGAEAWEKFMNQLTFAELKAQMSCQAKATATIAMKAVSSADGPAQLKGTPVGTYWCCETLIGTTWNTELAYKQGVMVGNEGLFQNKLGWWGPGMNIHRSPFSGRNFEYYSQDGVHSGYMAAAVVGGATSKGLITYAKHFAVNDQESFREANDGVATWVSEQAMREIYFKPFELAVKLGGCNGLMTSYNRIGAVSADVNYRLMQTLCRGEWGFKGNFVGDANAINARYYDGGTTKHDNLAIRTGCVTLGGAQQLAGTWDATLRGGKGGIVFDPEDYMVDPNGTSHVPEGAEPVEDYSGYYAMRTIAQNFLYININTFALRNGIDTSVFATSDSAVSLDDAYAGVSYGSDVSVSLEEANASYLKYEVTSGSLPDGLTMSEDGTISGTPTEKGSSTFTVTMTADYFETATQSYTIDVVSPFTVTGSLDNVALGDSDFEAQIAFNNASDYVNVTYSIVSGSLPAGVSMATDGLIYGAPTEAGEFTFTVRMTGQISGNRPTSVTFTETYTMTVSGGEAADPIAIGENGNWYINGVDTGVKAAGDTPTVSIGEDGYWYINGEKTDTLAQGPQGAQGEKGETGAQGPQGEPGEGGCGGNIAGTVVITALALAGLAAVYFVFRRKSGNK